MCQIAQSPSCADLELLPRKKAATREPWVEGLIVWDQVAAAVDSRRQHLWFQWSCRPCRIALSLVSLGDGYISGSFLRTDFVAICVGFGLIQNYQKVLLWSALLIFTLPCSHCCFFWGVGRRQRIHQQHSSVIQFKIRDSSLIDEGE